MHELFEKIQEVPKDEFIAVLEQNEREAERFKTRDDTAWKIIDFHRQNSYQTYKLIKLRREGFDRLVMPHHTHDADGFPSIGGDGADFWEVVEKYLVEKARPLQQGQECWGKVHELVRLKTWEANPTFVSNDPDFAVKSHYKRRPGEYLYAGGFHRLVAYGVWMKETNQYPPLTLYYCEVPADY
jgi:hypothetical protein